MIFLPRKTNKGLLIPLFLVVIGLLVAFPSDRFPGSRAIADFPNALPEVLSPFNGDPRLEPIPAGPIHLVDFKVFGNGKVLTMRFPPRVNGQTQSDGDKHADLFLFFNADTGVPIGQPPVLEAVPKNAAGPTGISISDLEARMFSAIWELHAVMVDPSYDPSDPAMLIDSAAKVLSSPLVRQIFQTNIFLNCPVVPVGSIVDPPAPQPEEAFFNGAIVNIVPYDIEDGGFNPQVLFKFEDGNGVLLGDTLGNNPHLVASRAPGDPFYSSIWEVWTVHVPNGTDVSNIKSANDVKAGGFPITSSGIRLNCPVIAVDGSPLQMETPFALLTDANGRFTPQKFPFDLLETTFTKSRTFAITEVTPGGVGAAPGGAHINNTGFPPVDPALKGNVIPLILQNPFQIISSGPNTTGDFLRIDQAELDAAFGNGERLPAPIEANFANLISFGLLPLEWGPGAGRTYPERLALVGRALFELVWKPEQGANTKSVTSCQACHSAPVAGAAGRGLYTTSAKVNPGSMWGSGAAELLVLQKKARGEAITNAHGSLGQFAFMRGEVSGVPNAIPNTHLGIQSSEFIQFTQNQLAPDKVKVCDLNGDGTVSLAEAAQCDLDGDGVVNEMTVGEVTAMTTFLMTLPVPNTAVDVVLGTLGVTRTSVRQGKRLFRQSIDSGGSSCSSCHTPFHPLSGTEFLLSNPQTPSQIHLQMAHHFADQEDVDDGLASSFGQVGLRLYGDFKKHKMGSKMSLGGTDTIKTAELWDAGSVFPYLRSGSLGSDLRAAILAHEGISLNALNKVGVRRDPQVNQVVNGQIKSNQRITVTNISPDQIAASLAQPIRVVLTGALSNGIQAANANGKAPDGGSRQGAFWLIPTTIAAGGSAVLDLVFDNPKGGPLQYDLAVQDHAGYSEGVAAARAFLALNATSQSDLINFLRAQLIGNRIGEGSGALLGPVGPPPFIQSISPTFVTAGSGGITLTLDGVEVFPFQPGDVIEVAKVPFGSQLEDVRKGIQISTEMVSSTRLIGQLGADLLATPGILEVHVQGLDGRESNVVDFVVKGTAEINWANPANILYGTALGNRQLNATANVPGTFVYTPPAGTVLNAGSSQNLHVDFTPTDTTDYNNASKDVKINILKANQSINFGPLAKKTFGDPPFNLNATASSGLPVSFSIISGPATISGNTVTVTGIGKVMVRASQDGNNNYNAALNVDQAFSVSPKLTAATITITPNKPKYGDSVTFVATLSPASVNNQAPATTVTFRIGLKNMAPVALGVGNGLLKGTLTMPVSMAPGSYRVTATFGGVNPNFIVSNPTTTLIILKK